MPAGYIAMDERYWPILIVRWCGVVTDQENRAFLERCDQLLSRRELGATLFDSRLAGWTPATQRNETAQWIKQNQERLSTLMVGSAQVFDSALVRGLLTAVLWMAPVPCPLSVFASPTPGYEWLCTKLKDKGVSAPNIPAKVLELGPGRLEGTGARVMR